MHVEELSLQNERRIQMSRDIRVLTPQPIPPQIDSST